jgi:hypothetical protein
VVRDPLDKAKRLLAAGKKWDAKPLLQVAARVAVDRAPVIDLLARNFTLVASAAERLRALSDPATSLEARIAAVRDTAEITDPRFAAPIVGLLEQLGDGTSAGYAPHDILERAWPCFGRADLDRLEALRQRVKDAQLRRNLDKTIKFLRNEALSPRTPTLDELSAALPHIPAREVATVFEAADRCMGAYDGSDLEDPATILRLVDDIERTLGEVEANPPIARDRIVEVFSLAFAHDSDVIAGLAKGKGRKRGKAK